MRIVGYAVLIVVLVAVLEVGCGQSAQSYLERGNSLFSSEKYEEAEIQYRKSLTKNPRWAEAYYRLGLTEIQLNHRPEALAALRRATDLAPDNDVYGVKLADI